MPSDGPTQGVVPRAGNVSDRPAERRYLEVHANRASGIEQRSSVGHA